MEHDKLEVKKQKRRCRAHHLSGRPSRRHDKTASVRRPWRFTGQNIRLERLFRTPQHVVHQRSVDVGATWADRVEERLVIGYEVPMVNQFFEKDLFIAGLA